MDESRRRKEKMKINIHCLCLLSVLIGFIFLILLNDIWYAIYLEMAKGMQLDVPSYAKFLSHTILTPNHLIWEMIFPSSWSILFSIFAWENVRITIWSDTSYKGGLFDKENAIIFDLPTPFVLHINCPHYWRYHLPGGYSLSL